MKFRILLPILALTLAPALAQQAAPVDEPTTEPVLDGADIYRSVVRIEVATQVPDYTIPWNSGRFSGGIGTGFLIGKNRFLTNAHVVSNARRLLITIHGSPRKYPARVEYIAHDCDLAVVSVEDFSDFADFPKLELGQVPALESHVRVIGYPIGGQRLSVTRGVVSRVDFQPYSHSRADSHLIVQIDAAINPGNSGGPVLQDGRVVGVAFQGLRSADNTGYMIPTPVIRRFLKDIEDDRYDQYVELGASTFQLFNPAMRRALGLPDDGKGVLISSITPQTPADGVLEPGDVLLELDGHPIDSAGMIDLDGKIVDMHEIIERKFVGDKAKLAFLRKGKRQEAEVTLKTLPWSRMYAIQYEKRPRYIVFGGLVFQPLDTNLYFTHKFTNIHVRKMFADYVPEGIFQEREDIVVLTQIEDDPLTSQIGDFSGMVLDKINDTTVKSLAHAHELLHPDNPPEFFTFEILGAQRPIVLPAAEIPAADQRIKAAYGIANLSNLKD